MKKSPLYAAALIGLAPGAAAAHHGWSSYDASRPITLTAPLTDVRWGNPHGTARVAYQRRAWAVVLAPVSRMEARGLARDMIGRGRRVTLVGYPRRDGTAEMRIERITVGDRIVELR